MFPQYTERQMGGELAIWLLITVGALLIPIIVVAICCIRRHCWQNIPTRRLPSSSAIITNNDELLINSNSSPHHISYNGPYVESSNDDVGVSAENNIALTFSRANSLKKQHVHWLDRSITSKIDDFYSIKHQQCTPQKQSISGEDTFNPTMLTESPLAHRNHAVIPISSSALSHFIPTMIIPVGSAVGNTGTSQLLTSSKEYTSIPVNHNIIM
ncbi:unnamed protein product [Rotaria sordida]|uniref:Uncharacterized protein n=1 Tax=Rotaria sordida TaxID=392033 RepID=A0A813W772_9BILA|nr:unnamed protein product [Rotaria sordida]